MTPIWGLNVSTEWIGLRAIGVGGQSRIWQYDHKTSWRALCSSAIVGVHVGKGEVDGRVDCVDRIGKWLDIEK